MLEYEREYMCTSCHYVFTKQADFEQFYSFTQQMSCPNSTDCKSNKFTNLNRDSELAACKDYQEIKIQEQVSSSCMSQWLYMSRIGRWKHVSVVLLHTHAQVGDIVTALLLMAGILHYLWFSLYILFVCIDTSMDHYIHIPIYIHTHPVDQCCI